MSEWLCSGLQSRLRRFDSGFSLHKLIMNIKSEHIIVSGGFDPIHSGHINLINNAAIYGKVIVIVNNDQFLLSKKGYFFMDINERIKILKNLKNVEEVFISIDKDHTVCNSINYLVKSSFYNIKYFANGGDRSNINEIPEYDVCIKNNIEPIFDIGGKKTQSSSSLTQRFYEIMLKQGHEDTIIKKPWGYYRNFIIEGNYLLKKIVVNPGEKLSEQTHNFRQEHWIIVEGKINVKNNKSSESFTSGEHIFIERGSIHRISNPFEEKAIIIEVQIGTILSELDIIRLKDKYKR